MTRTRLGLLSLCAMVLGLMAISTAAHAKAGEWFLAEKEPGTKLIPFLEAEFQVEKDKEKEVYVLHSEILKIKTLFLCTGIKLVGNPKLQAPDKTTTFKVLFSGCETDLNGTPNANCKPKDPDGDGTIVTASLHALALLHELLPSGELDDVIKILPVSGETFATIEMGAACPIGTKVPVIGELALEDCEKLALVHLVKHLLKVFEPLTKLWVISKTVEHMATLLGSAWVFLVGLHEGIKFSWN